MENEKTTSLALTEEEERRLTMLLNEHGQVIRLHANRNGTWYKVKATNPRNAAFDARADAKTLFARASNVTRWDEDTYGFQVTTHKPRFDGPGTIHKAGSFGRVGEIRVVRSETTDQRYVKAAENGHKMYEWHGSVYCQECGLYLEDAQNEPCQWTAEDNAHEQAAR